MIPKNDFGFLHDIKTLGYMNPRGLILRERFRHNGASYWKLNELQTRTKQRVEQRIASGAYAFVESLCEMCASHDFDLLASRDRYGLWTRVCICRHCGLIQVTPKMDSKALDQFYREDYRPLYIGQVSDLSKVHMDEYMRGTRIAYYIKETCGVQMPHGALVVEIGTGTGGILRAFRELGAQVIGVDVNSTYLEYGRREFGLDVRKGTLETLALKGPPFLLIFSHVLEHLPNPGQHLQLAKGILGKEGRLYIEVPGVRWLRRGDYDFLSTLQSAHLYYFTLRTLGNMLRREGMHIVSGDESIRCLAVLGLDSAVQEDPASEHDSVLRYLRSVERERRFLPFAPWPMLRRARSLAGQILGHNHE
jgi:2-polyprenyl-3-methyl-5-hydroxy-6-metoxy-1,4-benzoquinol methylase